MKTPVVIKDDYIIYFEPIDAGVIIHCDVFKWNKTTKGNLKQDFETLKTLHQQPILAMHELKQGNKHIKFLEMFGFKFFEQVKDLKGNQVDFYITNEDKI